MSPQERSDLLVRVDERTAKLETWSSEHMAHHQKILGYFITACISVVLAEMTTIVGLIITMSSGHP